MNNRFISVTVTNASCTLVCHSFLPSFTCSNRLEKNLRIFIRTYIGYFSSFSPGVLQTWRRKISQSLLFGSCVLKCCTHYLIGNSVFYRLDRMGGTGFEKQGTLVRGSTQTGVGPGESFEYTRMLICILLARLRCICHFWSAAEPGRGRSKSNKTELDWTEEVAGPMRWSNAKWTSR